MIGQPRHPAYGCFASADELENELDHFGIERAVVFHYLAMPYESRVGNELLLSTIADHPRLLPAWVIPLQSAPHAGDPQSLVSEMLGKGVHVARVGSPGYLAFGALPHTTIFDWGAGRVFEALAEHRVPTLLCGTDLTRYGYRKSHGFSDADLVQLSEEYPDLPLILVGFTTTMTRVAMPILERCKNLFVEISYFSAHRGVDYLCQTIGADRLIFGSGMPRGNAAPALFMLETSDISDAERNAIASGNLQRLLDGVVL